MDGAVLTRFHSEDYKVFFAPGLYADFLKKVEAVGFSRAMDDTKPGMLYWREKTRSWLWVTGVPSARKDRIGTPIRFNLLLADSDAVIRNWGAHCLALLASPADGGLRRLGEAWDALIVDNQAFRAGVGFSHLFACLEQVLQTGFEGGLSQQLVKDYCILSPLVPEAEFIRDVLIDTSLQGAVWSRGRLEEVPAAKKKSSPAAGILRLSAILCLLACGCWFVMEHSWDTISSKISGIWQGASGLKTEQPAAPHKTASPETPDKEEAQGSRTAKRADQDRPEQKAVPEASSASRSPQPKEDLQGTAVKEKPEQGKTVRKTSSKQKANQRPLPEKEGKSAKNDSAPGSRKNGTTSPPQPKQKPH